MSRTRAAALPWLLVALCGCAAAPAPHPQPDLLGFLDQERVTRDEVHARLGPPSAIFEHDSVLTYRLAHSTAGYVIVAPSPKAAELGWEGVDYDLVLVFGDDGTLHQHRLVAVRVAPPKP